MEQEEDEEEQEFNEEIDAGDYVMKNLNKN